MLILRKPRFAADKIFRNLKVSYSHRKLDLKHIVLIGTHHKAGTIWMSKVFRGICFKLNLSFFSGQQEHLPINADVFFQYNSKFDLDELKKVFAYKGLHLIRDPRDMIVSGCFYHQRAPRHKEEWLYTKNDMFGGLTYQEKLNSYSSIDDKLLFEMENFAQINMANITKWCYNDPNFLEIKYEDLIIDYDMLLFHKIFSHLGFSGEVIPDVLQIAFKNSLFSGRLRDSGHIRSGSVNQWKNHFKQSHRVRFQELFGNVLIRLGYEDNDDWIQQDL